MIRRIRSFFGRSSTGTNYEAPDQLATVRNEANNEHSYETGLFSAESFRPPVEHTRLVANPTQDSITLPLFKIPARSKETIQGNIEAALDRISSMRKYDDVILQEQLNAAEAQIAKLREFITKEKYDILAATIEIMTIEAALAEIYSESPVINKPILPRFQTVGASECISLNEPATKKSATFSPPTPTNG